MAARRRVMASYNAWNGTAMAVNPILRSIVREQWGVDVISSDGGAVKLLVDPRHLFPDQKAAVVACLKAGINQFLDVYKDETKAALKDGEITEAEIDALLQAEVRGHDPARAAGSAGDGSLLEDQGLAGAVEYRQGPRC